MSKRQHGRRQEMTPTTWSHLPPLEASTMLRINAKGKARAPYKLATPVNDFDIPLPDKILEGALRTLDANYIFPPIKGRDHRSLYNDHHCAYPRSRYYYHPSHSPIPSLYRESASLMIRLPVQLHNYIHEIYDLPPDVDMDVMRQWAQEQTQVNQLFHLGKSAIQLSRLRFDGETDTTVRFDLQQRAKKDARVAQHMFYDFLYEYPDGILGLMPEKDWVASEPFPHAVRALGSIAGARSIDVRRHTYDLLKKYGFHPAA